MRKYSPVIGLIAIITAMAIFQFGALEVDAASSTISSQFNQMDRPTVGGGPLMVPMDTRLAKGKGDDEDAGGNKKAGESEDKPDRPDLRTVDWSKDGAAQKVVSNDNGAADADENNGDDEDEDGDKEREEKSEGIDRLWDVVSNG